MAAAGAGEAAGRGPGHPSAARRPRGSAAITRRRAPRPLLKGRACTKPGRARTRPPARQSPAALQRGLRGRQSPGAFRRGPAANQRAAVGAGGEGLWAEGGAARPGPSVGSRESRGGGARPAGAQRSVGSSELRIAQLFGFWGFFFLFAGVCVFCLFVFVFLFFSPPFPHFPRLFPGWAQL